jgi:gamma-glutamyltranspeptidase / glutathione hydrolase
MAMPKSALKKTIICHTTIAFSLLILTSCVAPVAVTPAGPSLLTSPKQTAVTTAHPLASAAALRVLNAGGSPIDAAIAAQMVLGLVEAQASGIGGGSLLMHFDAKTKKLESFDGLAAAPSRVTNALTIDTDGSVISSDLVQRGGRSAGVPGTLSVLKQVHGHHGKLPWATLFAPAIELAESGYPMAAYMHGILSLPNAAADNPELVPYLFTSDGKPKAIGSTIKNPTYAATMRRIAKYGPEQAWGKDNVDLIAAVQRGNRPSLMTSNDVSSYQPLAREPLCAPFLSYSVCVMAPPSFGGIVVLQMLQMLEHRATASSVGNKFNFSDPEFLHAYVESGRLAQADRLQYVGDPGFTRIPTDALLALEYLKERARTIAPTGTTPDVKPGNFDKKVAVQELAPEAQSADATSQIAIVDKDGNALSMTTTNNLNFGARLLANGAVINNALTNFTGVPRAGQAAPNRMQAGKRPVTSMAPTIVFDRSGTPVAIGGSAGGGQIVDYIARTLVEMLANDRTPADAIAQGHVSTAIRGKVQLEKDTQVATLAEALRAKGHVVEIVTMPSGLGFLLRQGSGWIGAADPRRDGVAMGR